MLFYKIGICFSYQKCLFCFTDLTQDLCECDTNQKPTRNKTQSKSQIYSRLYNPNNIQINQKLFLKNYDHIFAFKETNFSSATTSVSNHAKKRVKDTDFSLTTSINDDNDSDSSINSISSEKGSNFDSKFE
ncbi:6894_t:CDS:2, partial [Scutellospora calospora]